MAKTPLTLWHLTARPARSRAKVPPRSVRIYVRAASRDEAIELISGGVIITRCVEIKHGGKRGH